MKDFKIMIGRPIKIYENNSGVIAICKFGNLTKNSKYNEVHLHFVNECYESKKIEIITLFIQRYNYLLLYNIITYTSTIFQDLEEYAGPIQILGNYPAKGFCIKYSNVQNMDDFVNWAFLIINYLQNNQIAHNIYITRGKSNIKENKEEYRDVRIYIWARKSSQGAKDIHAFNLAACELFGHLSIKCE